MKNKRYNHILTFFRKGISKGLLIFLLVAVTCIQIINPVLFNGDELLNAQALEIECEKETKSAEKILDIDFWVSLAHFSNKDFLKSELSYFQYKVSFASVTLEHFTPPPELI